MYQNCQDSVRYKQTRKNKKIKPSGTFTFMREKCYIRRVEKLELWNSSFSEMWFKIVFHRVPG